MKIFVFILCASLVFGMEQENEKLKAVNRQLKKALKSVSKQENEVGFTIWVESCVNAAGTACVDDTSHYAETHDLKQDCCTRSDGYVGTGGRYTDGKSCRDLGFTKYKGTALVSKDNPTYATTMCGQSYGAIVQKTGLRGNCGGMEIFASCNQMLAMYEKDANDGVVGRWDGRREMEEEN